jgi:hypothetical protein
LSPGGACPYESAIFSRVDAALSQPGGTFFQTDMFSGADGTFSRANGTISQTEGTFSRTDGAFSWADSMFLQTGVSARAHQGGDASFHQECIFWMR